MPLKLNELIKKAKTRGIEISSTPQSLAEAIRPWQQESTLFVSINNSETNRQQTNNKSTTNQQQIDNKPTTNRQQKRVEKKETDNKVITQSATHSTTNRQQTDNKPTTKHNFSSLVGLQRSLVIFIYNECRNARSKSTENLTLECISKVINSSSGCIKTTLQRLELKGLIDRVEHKNGRGGWSRYSIPDHHFQKILQYESGNKSITKWQQIDNKSITKLITQPTTSVFSSSSTLNTTTTSEDKNNFEHNLCEDWQLDIEPLQQIGFTKTHMKQIVSQNKLSLQSVQDSIYAFAFDLQENNKAKSIKGDPINYFMGILRNGRVYTFPSNYESPQDRAMRLYTEQIRVVDQKRKLLEKEAIDLAFNSWVSQLNEAQKIEFLPKNLQNTKVVFGKNKMIESSARSYFEAEIWPNKKKEITKSARNPEQNLQNQILTTNIEQEVLNVENT